MIICKLIMAKLSNWDNSTYSTIHVCTDTWIHGYIQLWHIHLSMYPKLPSIQWYVSGVWTLLDKLSFFCHILVNFVDFSSIQKHSNIRIPMNKLSIIQVSMLSNYPWYPTIHDIQLSMVSIYPISVHLSKYPWYPSIQVSMVSKYPNIRKNWYPLISLPA